jgi:hypothetical protein
MSKHAPKQRTATATATFGRQVDDMLHKQLGRLGLAGTRLAGDDSHLIIHDNQ